MPVRKEGRVVASAVKDAADEFGIGFADVVGAAFSTNSLVEV